MISSSRLLVTLVLLLLATGVAAVAASELTCEALCVAACAPDPTPLPGDPATLTWQSYGEYTPLGPSCMPTQAERAFGARGRPCSYYRNRIAWLETQPALAASLPYSLEQRRRLTQAPETNMTFVRLCIEHYGYAMRATQGYDVWIEDFDTGERLTPPLGISGNETKRCTDVDFDAQPGRRLACGWATKPGMTPVYAYPECKLEGFVR